MSDELGAGPPDDEYWRGLRGIRTADYTGSAYFARAPLEETGRAVLGLVPGARRDTNVLGRKVRLAGEGLLLFRIAGHSWTELLYDLRTFDFTLPEGFAARLSTALDTRVIEYFVSGAAGVQGCEVHERGSMVEKIETSSPGGEGGGAHRLFIANDVLEPGLSFSHFIGGGDYGPGEEVEIGQPTLLFAETGSDRITRPPLERVDYIALSG